MIRKTLIAAGFLAVLALIVKPVWDGREQWHFGQSYDDGIYWVSAKSLAQGNGYRVESLPGQPFAIKYPPLYPLYLSLAWRLNPAFPANLPLAAALQAMLLPVYLALLLLVFRQLHFSWRRIFLLAAMTFVIFYLVLAAITLLSDLLFCCFLLAAMWTVERSAAAATGSGRWWAAIGGLLAGAAYLTRVAALPLFIAVPVFYWLRRRNRLTGFFLAVALPIAAAWSLWTFTHSTADPSNLSYLQEYSRVVGAGGIWTNFLKQIASLSASVAESFYSGMIEALAGIPLYHLVLIAAVVGAVRLGKRLKWPVYVIFAGFYLIMLALWWFEGLTRLLIPVWPILLAGVAEEASHFAALCEQAIEKSKGWRARIPKPALGWVLVIAGYLIVAHNDRVTGQRVDSIMAEERTNHARDLAAFEWIARNAGKDTVVLAWKDAPVFLYTGVPASHPLFLAMTPGNGEIRPLSASLATLPPSFHRGLLLLLSSDLAAGSRTPGGPGEDNLPGLAGSKLEYRGDGALIYSLPLVR